MRIALLSDHESTGGAAIAASRLAAGLIDAGHEVVRLVNSPDGRRHEWTVRKLTVGAQRSLPQRLLGRLMTTALRQVMSQREMIAGLDSMLQELQPDIINVHNIHGIDQPLGLVDTCCKHTNVVWTLHDMWSFTGRCAYAYDCRRFVGGCNAACPSPKEYPALEPSRIEQAWKRRESLFAERAEMVAITPSRWLRQEALNGLWKGHRVEHIANGLPLGTYRPEDRAFARKALDLPESSAPVLMVAAQDLSDRRKGGAQLWQALRQVSRRPLTVLTLGDGSLPEPIEGVDVRPLGYVDHERTKVLAYNAADAFVHPAPVDNLPNVVVEAIACGTPVIAFPTGGLPELVQPGQTGWLASDNTAAALAASIDEAVVDLSSGADLRAICRAAAENHYSIERQARQYLALFSSLLGAVSAVTSLTEIV